MKIELEETITKEDEYSISRFFSKEQEEYNAEGFSGWLLFGFLSQQTFRFASDHFYERYVVNWMGLNPFFSDITRSWWSLGAWVRTLSNVFTSFISMFFWTYSLFGGYTSDVMLYNV